MSQSHPYMANSAEGSRQALLDGIGIADAEELFAQIPADHRADDKVQPVPGIKSEFE